MEQDWKDEVLFTVPSKDWRKPMPVTLIHLDGGKSYALHIQTGDHYKEALDTARRVLILSKSLAVGEPTLIGPTGVYHKVGRIVW